MTEVHLHIISTGQILDLYENETIAQNWQYTNFQDFGSNGDFTRQFRIPATANNVSIIGALQSPNAVPAENYFHKKLPCELRVDTIPVSLGHIRVMQAITQADVLTDFEVTYYGVTPDLSRSIGDKKLSDIAALSTLNHTSSASELTATTGDYIYALIERGQKFSEGGQAGTRMIYSDNHPLYAADFTPCVSWGFLFRNIVSEAGFTLDALPLLNELDDYYMPFTNSKFLRTTEQPSDYFFNAGYTTNQSSGSPVSMTEFFDNNNDYDNATTPFGSDFGTYTTPFTGWFTFRIWLTIDINSSNSTNFGVRLYNKVTNETLKVWYGFISASTASSSNFANGVYSAEIYVDGNTQIQWDIFNAQASYTLQGSPSNDPESGTGWALVGVSQAMYGQTIDMAANAPDMKQIEFLRDVINMHCCAVIPSRTIPNEIKIIPQKDYIGQGDDVDWTDKLDVSKDVVIKPTTEFQKARLKFTYKAGGEYASKLYSDAGRVYGDYKVEGYTVSGNDEPSDFTQGDLTIQLTTCSTPANYIDGTNVIVPSFTNESREYVAPGPRALYVAGSADVSVLDDSLVTPAIVLITVNLVNNYSDTNATLLDQDLNFAPEVPLHLIEANPYYNRFNKFWRSYLNELYSPEARMMIAYFKLDLPDIVNFSFANRYFIKDAWWRILSINDYRIGGKDTVQVTLIKLLNDKADCEGIPASVSAGGVVSFEDVNGNPVTATSLCCKRYGYFWNAALNRCQTIFNGIGGGRGGITPNFDQPIGSVTGLTGQMPDRSMIIVAGLNSGADNAYSVMAGNFFDIEEGNPMTLAVGDTIRMEGANRGAVLLGKNVYTNLPGIHLGGGWFDDDRASIPDGAQQTGTILFSVKGAFTTNTTKLELLIEGISGKRLTIPDKTGWACVLTVYTAQVTASAISNQSAAQFGFYISKATTASAGTVHDIWHETSFNKPELTIDTTTDTDEHRLQISKSGAGHPFNNCWIVARLDYTQFRHD